jgi:hypothetical protein
LQRLTMAMRLTSGSRTRKLRPNRLADRLWRARGRTAKAAAAAAAIGLSIALLLPAHAQFWDWGGAPRYQRFDPFRDLFGGFRRQGPRGGWGGEGDTSHAPAPGQKRPEVTTPIVVMGDANADWLAYGLEDSLSERPEIGIIRKHRTDSGLIRYDQRRDSTEWPQVAREIIAAEKPKVIVMMIGNNDRQQIREKAPPPPPRPGAPGAPGKPAAAPVQQPAQAAHPASPAPAATPAVDADAERQREAPSPDQSRMTPEQARQASYGPWEFHTEKWEIAYIKRVDATISALKSAGVPVIWVGLPSQRNTKPSADSAYLNEIYRSRAEKAGITYVDIWDGFVDESGHYSPQGPDYEGQIRRLRSDDGVYFTKFGARKIAHYVQREIERLLVNRAPVALPAPADAGTAANVKPGNPAQRPAVGPALPLTAANFGSDELVGGGRQPKSAGLDATVTRVLTRGEPVAPPTGRADDFSWPPRGVNIDTNLPEAPPAPALQPSDTADKQAASKQQHSDTQAAARTPAQRRPYGGGFQPFRFPFFGLFR